MLRTVLKNGAPLRTQKALNFKRLPNKRYFCQQAKPKTTAEAKPPGTAPPIPPPPPGGSGGGGGGKWILLTALLGAGYYFREEIMEFTGVGGKKPEDVLVENVEKTKKSIEDVEARLEKAGAAAAEAAKEKAKALQSKVQGKVDEAKEALVEATADSSAKADWTKIREEVVDILEAAEYDDGSYGPVLVRLAWHNAGTYDKNTKKGGTEGAAMRFEPEAKWGANAGLNVARDILEPIKKKHPEITYSDLWSFAGTVAIEEMGGPTMKWRPGRKDCKEGENVLPDGLLPDADGRETPEKPQDHVRKIFDRMGLNDQEMVALIGAHALGRVHMDRSGYWGPWTRAPTTFSNEFFRVLLEEKWTKKQKHKNAPWSGPFQYEDESGDLMMLPTDLCLVQDEKFKKYVELYAKDEQKFFNDFAKAWIKLQELGVRRFHAWPKYIFFGPRE